MAEQDNRALLDDLARDPLVFLHQIDLLAGAGLLVRLERARFAEHSFLDQRVLSPRTTGAWFSWDDIERAAGLLPDKGVSVIFHLGHCGSTLISRLVSAASRAQALREPLVLRALALDAAEGANAYLSPQARRERLRVCERIFARGAAPVVVKATSIASALIGDRPDNASDLFVYQKPETHLAVILAGPNSAVDLKAFAPMRRKRLAALAPDIAPVHALSAGELAALSWLSEATAALDAVENGRVAGVDFDRFLGAPAENLKAACAALRIETNEAACQAALEGPIMTRYSKAPEHGYSADLRNQVIAAAKRDHKSEIRKGLAFIESAANLAPPLAGALARFG
ncbi:MAG: hypothetical protein GC153_00535 [Alphaproteobacteria bacterium]|nr:hypothetical protein [Alphaproteobacteria bacterium]